MSQREAAPMSRPQSSLRRRCLVFALGAAAAAAVIGPASASAGWYTIDDLGNSTPAGHPGPSDDLPQPPDDDPVYVATEVGSTIPTRLVISRSVT